MPAPKYFDKNKNRQVIETISCPKCGSAKGNKCTTYNGRTLHVAHKDRYDAFDGLQKLNAEEKQAAKDRLLEDEAQAAEAQGFLEAVKTLEVGNVSMPSFDDVVSVLVGRTPAELNVRNKLIEQVEGGLHKLYDLLDKDEALYKIAEAIVDGKTDVFKLRNN